MARDRKITTENIFNATKELLLLYGYEGFTISLLAEQLHVSRGAVYKYYNHKEAVISDMMEYEMKRFISELQEIETYQDFEAQFDFLLTLIFKQTEVHQLIQIAQHMLANHNDNLRDYKPKLEKLPLEMYRYLKGFITQGKKEGKLKAHLPDPLLLGIIFQSIAIPNHFGVPRLEWVSSIKEIISVGMFTDVN